MNRFKRQVVNLVSNREKKICQQEDEVVQESTSTEHETSAEHTDELYLSLLSNEILLKIYCHLSPVDLISIAKLNDKRLTELTYAVRQANFSACRTADPVFISSFLSKDRVKLIQKLNFNYYFYLKPLELTNFICRCKNLTSLSVVNCGLSYANIFRILGSCKQLEVLAWDIGMIPAEENCGYFPNLKKLYLFRKHQNTLQSFGRELGALLQAFPDVEEVWYDFDYDCNNSILPFIGMWSVVSLLSNEEMCNHRNKRLMLIANTSLYEEEMTLGLQFNRESFFVYFLDARNLTGADLCTSMVSVPPYLQIQSNVQEVQSLSAGPSRAYSTLVIIATDEIIDVSENLVKGLQKVAGDKLENLSFVIHKVKKLDDRIVLVQPEEYISICDKICDVAEKIFLTSKYITLLNLITVHMSSNSPIRAITQLENLKVLNLPSCAFRNKIRTNDSENLSSVVSACAKIEEFVLYCCSESAPLLTSDDLLCLQNWSHLKHLSVIYSHVLRSFAFLKKVADFCVQLSSLTLISQPCIASSVIVNDVVYLLKKAKNLKFFRINDENFNPMFERFWPAIGEAVNLEGICIATRSNIRVSTQVVIKEIKKLKYLHLLHFSANVPDTLWKEVKKSMQDQGIENITCKKACLSERLRSHSNRREIYHYRPNQIECLYQHLKDINIF